MQNQSFFGTFRKRFHALGGQPNMKKFFLVGQNLKIAWQMEGGGLKNPKNRVKSLANKHFVVVG